jgi:hypothetical protein
LRVRSLAEVLKLSNKNSTALATLVVALPAALLGFFLVNTFLSNLDHLREHGTMYMALYGTTLAACAGMVFLPVAVLIFGPRAPKAAGAPKSGTDVKAAPKSGTVPKPETGEMEAAPSADSVAAFDEAGERKAGKAMSTGELEVVDEPTPSMEHIAAYDDEEGASGAGMPTGELEVVEPTPSMEDLVAYDEEALPKTGEHPAVDLEEEFAFEEEPVPAPKPAKKKGK